MKDPFERVNGSGIQKLKDAGIEITWPVLEDECRFINRRFITFQEKKRPYIILKWAESNDGFIGRINEKVMISNQYAQVMVHRWRSEEQAIMAGPRTLMNDNPHLNVRYWTGKNPVKITIDRQSSLSNDLNFFRDGKQIVFTYADKKSTPACSYLRLEKNKDELQQVMILLHQQGIQSVFVEGGLQLLQSLIEEKLWDEARVFYAPVKLEKGIAAPQLSTPLHHTEILADNELKIYYNQ